MVYFLYIENLFNLFPFGLQFMKKQEAEEKRNSLFMSMDERKRPFNSMVNVSEPSEEEMEAYRRRMQLAEDPMSKFLTWTSANADRLYL